MARKVSLLGGTFTRPFSANVTLVIAATNASPKIFEARAAKVPIVRDSWLEHCVDSLTRVALDAFLLPPFEGLSVTSSDLPPAQHRECRKRIVDGGGKWSDELTGETTFLLADFLAHTKKIGIALRHSIPIVRPCFVEDSSRFEMINWWCMSDAKSSLFRDMIFSIHRAVEEVEAIQEAIVAHMGTVGSSSTHVILPHGVANPFPGSIAVTSAWLWGCADARRILPVDGSLLFAPLPYRAPIRAVSGRVFFLAELRPETKRELADMVRFAGGQVVYKMATGVHFAVAEVATKELVRIGLDGRVVVVKPAFVVEMVRTGALPEPKAFRLEGIAKTAILKKLCKCITGANVLPEPEIPAEFERSDLETFTQELNSTQNEVALEVKYESDHHVRQQDEALSADPLIALLDRRI
jgi:hypothetical protein